MKILNLHRGYRLFLSIFVCISYIVEVVHGNVFYTDGGEETLLQWVKAAQAGLKIYIYPHPRNPEDSQQRKIIHNHFMIEKFFVDYLRRILNSKKKYSFEDSRRSLVVDKPEEANAFIIDHNWITRGHLYTNCTEFYIRNMFPIINTVVDKYPYFNRSGGRDHFFFAVHGKILKKKYSSNRIE